MKVGNEGHARFLGVGLVALVAIFILAYILTNTLTTASRSAVTTTRRAKNIPVVEDYYSKNWDYRARNGDDQVFVIVNDEPFEKLLFRTACAIALCAHMGYAPPILVARASRPFDSPATPKELPELIQDIFPRLRILNVPSPKEFIRTTFPNAMCVRGEITRAGKFDFLEFPQITSTTIVLDGDWESWKYTEDYRASIFESLEFHPSIYHYARKTYPMLFDRKHAVTGVVVGDRIGENTETEIRDFLSSREHDRILVFATAGVPDSLEFGQNAVVVSGESSQVIIYLAAFFKSVLIDSSLLGWWAGMHAYFRGKSVTYISDNESEHFMSPHWTRNKSVQ